jgi:hypothetical protein
MLSAFVDKIRVRFTAGGAPVAVKRRAVNEPILLKTPCITLLLRILHKLKSLALFKTRIVINGNELFC